MSAMAGTPGSTEYAARLSKRSLYLITGAVLLATFLASLDGTIVSTAMPTIVRELHGIDRYAWVFSGFLLAQIATIPLWGRLADMFGRKRIFLIGMVIFMAGSALSGTAQSMTALVAFRAFQGLGAACLMTVTQTIVADLYTLEQRAKVTSIYAMTFASSSILGPLVGGFFTDSVSWRWIFYINLPTGLGIMILVYFVLVEPLQERRRHRLDWWGTATMLGWAGLLVFALQSGGRDYAWGSDTIIGCFAAAVALLIGFVFIERRVSEPVVPLDLFRIPALRASSILVAFLGMAMFGAISFLPLFVQVVVGTSATGAGRVLTPMMLSMMAASAIGAPLVLRVGYRILLAAGSVMLLVGYGLLTRLNVEATQLEVARDMVFLGAGMGFVFTATTLAAQNSVALPRQGVATSMINFTRQLGGAIGVAIAAAVMLDGVTSRLTPVFGSDFDASGLLTPKGGGGARGEVPFVVREAFAFGLHHTFWTMAFIALGGTLLTLLMPRGKAQDIRAASLAMQAGEDGVLVEMAEAAGAAAGDNVPIEMPGPIEVYRSQEPGSGESGSGESGSGAPGRSPAPERSSEAETVP